MGVALSKSDREIRGYLGTYRGIFPTTDSLCSFAECEFTFSYKSIAVTKCGQSNPKSTEIMKDISYHKRRENELFDTFVVKKEGERIFILVFSKPKDLPETKKKDEPSERIWTHHKHHGLTLYDGFMTDVNRPHLLAKRGIGLESYLTNNALSVIPRIRLQ